MSKITVTIRVDIEEASGPGSLHERTLPVWHPDNPRFFASYVDDGIKRAAEDVIAAVVSNYGRKPA